jgi:hypothetical protein
MLRNSAGIGSLALAAAVLALTGCETVVDKVGESFHTMMTGTEEVPGPGDPDGRGRAEVSIIDKLDQFCYEIEDVARIGPATAAHIHRGARGVAGPIVVPLDPPTDGDSNGCPKVPEDIADEIQANPRNFYVNVHNAEFPAGAIRGQLRPSRH